MSNNTYNYYKNFTMNMLSELLENFPEMFSQSEDSEDPVSYNVDTGDDVEVQTEDAEIVEVEEIPVTENVNEFEDIDSLLNIDSSEVTYDISNDDEEELVERAVTIASEIVSSNEDTSNLIENIEEEEELEVDPPEEESPESTVTTSEIIRGRFKGAPWYHIAEKQYVTLAGLGGIGSWVSMLISRLNVSMLYLFDPDRFEAVNMSGQLVSRQHIGISKAYAALDIAHTFSNYDKAVTRMSHFTILDDCTPVFICGFDNMEARKTAFSVWERQLNKSDSPEEYLFIDGRLTAEMFQIMVISGDDNYAINKYKEDWLFDDSQADEADCTFKQTSHIAAMIASYITMYFTNWCNNKDPENFPRRIPWFTEFNAVLNTHKYEY